MMFKEFEDLIGCTVEMGVEFTARNKILAIDGDRVKMFCDSGFVFYMSTEELELGIADGSYEII